MSEIRTMGDLVRALAGLAEVNRCDFDRSPALVRTYERALSATAEKSASPFRFVWIPDRKTEACARPNCWPPFRGLVELYPLGPIFIDCKGISATHAAYLAHKGQVAWVGIRPGRTVSHALCGWGDRAGRAPETALDLSVVAGMPPLTSYRGFIHWQKVPPCSPSSSLSAS